MKSPNDIPLIADIVLIGGGHAHVHILKMAGMEPLKSIIQQNGIQITLVSSTVLTPYSGMLPGFIAGHYTEDEIHLDLRKLCSFGNVKFIHAAATGITYENGDSCDIKKKSITGARGVVKLSDGRPDIRYDALSIDIGSSPSLPAEFSSMHDRNEITPVKPIATFSKRWQSICDRLRAAPIDTYSSTRPFKLVVVGGGAGGLELTLSARHALINIMNEKINHDRREKLSKQFDDCIHITVATRGNDLLSGHNSSVRSIFKRILSEKNVEIRYNAEVIGIIDTQDGKTVANSLRTLKLSQSSQDQQPIYFHECLFCTSANASSWLTTQTPFDTTDSNFVKVNNTYECVNHPGVFAVGDCCHLVDDPRPKAGVFAVRAGPIVKDNLIAYILNQPLTNHKPQTEFLGLISTGEKYAVASRGGHALEGGFLWTLKDQIDRTWMDGYQNLPTMEEESMTNSNPESDSNNGLQTNFIPNSLFNRGPDALAAFAEVNMRCGGCGAKVGSTTLTRVLDTVHRRRTSRSTTNIRTKKIDPDDAAIVHLPKGCSGGAMIHTIDFFRSFISDPYTFGMIAAVHALSDIHAMGADAINALALAVVPFAATESITEFTLIDMLSGASDVFDEENCELIGGHTCEGAELALGFAVNGFTSEPRSLLRKRGGKVGDKIILTKPLGTGALFAADMRAKCRGIHVEEAITSMKTSNRLASKVAMQFISKTKRIHAATDVTGFGLIGHLLEMLIANDATDDEMDIEESISAVIFTEEIPFLAGGMEAIENGITSSLQRENFRNRRAVSNHDDAIKQYPIKYPLLFDPQTAGGLLFFVDPTICDDFLRCLRHDNGIVEAHIIGEITKYSQNLEYVCDDTVCSSFQTKDRILIK